MLLRYQTIEEGIAGTIEAIQREVQKHRPVIVGLAGGSASGKGYVGSSLVARLGIDNAELFSMDDYYKDLERLPEPDNHDRPDALHLDLLAAHLRELREGQRIYRPEYSFETHRRVGNNSYRFTGEVLIIDGLFALHEEIREHLHLGVFVDAPEEVRLARRIERDVRERGRTEESVRAKWDATVERMYRQHIAPQRDYANIVIENADVLDIFLSHTPKHQ